MNAICLNFKVHQPYYYKKYHFFDIGVTHDYYDHSRNEEMIRRVSRSCYIPTNNMLLKLIERYGDKLSFSMTISGTTMEMLENYAPEVLKSFQTLVSTGSVELMSTPYYHSMAMVKSSDEFKCQVTQHQKKTKELFGVNCRNFANTDLIYADYLGIILSEMGFRGVVTEGAKYVLGWRSPNYVYSNPIARNLKILFRNQQLSDDISLRFSNSYWAGYPLTAEKFSDWLCRDPNHKCVTIAMDYKVIGYYMERSSGIFGFFENLPQTIFRNTDFKFLSPNTIFSHSDAVAPVYIPNEISWMSAERDISPWLGNELQKDFFRKLYRLEEAVKRINEPKILEDWRRLQSVDNLFDMNFRWLNEHQFDVDNPQSPYEAYINNMNILNDLEMRLQQIRFSRMVIRNKLQNTVEV